MRRATTPVHSFTFPFDPEQLTKILLTYSQNDEVILNKIPTTQIKQQIIISSTALTTAQKFDNMLWYQILT